MTRNNNKQNGKAHRVAPLENKDLLNENETKVIKALIERPGLTRYIDVQNHVGLSSSTAKTVVDRLDDSGYIRKGWVVNYHKIGYEVCYRIDVILDPHSIHPSRDKETGIPIDNPQLVIAHAILEMVEKPPFKNWVIIENIEVLLGDPSDLCITARVAEHGDIFQFVTRGLRSLQGIRQTSTCQIAWSIRGEQSAPTDEFGA